MRLGIRLALALFVSLQLPPAWSAEQIELSLPDLQDKQRQLSEFRGKWVLVNYWATWCPPCLEELPELEIFHNNHKQKDAVVIGINKEDITREALQAFIEEQFLSFPILRDKAMRKTVFGPVTALPTSFLITPEGILVAKQVGPVDGEMIEDFINNYTVKQRSSQAAAKSSQAAAGAADGL